jgi:tyrosinase
LHHGWVDRLWWEWQERDRSKRLKDMSGTNTMDPVTGFFEFFPILGNLTVQLNIFGHPTPEILALAPNPRNGDPGNVTTLNHVLTSLGVIPDVRIKDVMDTTGGYLCYTFA